MCADLRMGWGTQERWCCVKQKDRDEDFSGDLCCQLSGQWRTVYFASSASEKTKDDGLLRLYICKVVFNDEEGTVDVYLCVE